MDYRLYFGVAFRIVLFFSFAIAATFIPDQLRDFFGDEPYLECQHKDRYCKSQPNLSGWHEDCTVIGYKKRHASVKSKGCGVGEFDRGWYWGARHYWYFWMMVCLALLSALSVVISSAMLFHKYYPDPEQVFESGEQYSHGGGS